MGEDELDCPNVETCESRHLDATGDCGQLPANVTDEVEAACYDGPMD
jgi:hypothetical protein